MTDQDLQYVIETAEKAGRLLLGYSDKAAEITEKTGANNVVTKADLASEKLIVEHLTKRFPKFNIYAEEGGAVDKGSDKTIVIDPLDGTTNFVIGIPTFAVSIAILDKNRSVLGVVHNPILKRTYWATVGKGAFMNGQPIKVSQTDTVTKAIVGFGSGYETPKSYEQQFIKHCHDARVKRVLTDWAPAYMLCLLASGKIEGIVSNGLDFEDYAAAKLIVREAGGKITDFNGIEIDDDRQQVFIACNEKLASQLLLLAH